MMQTLTPSYKAPKLPARARSAAALKNQRGLSLLESLVALLVLALGILGLVAAQTRTLVETRTTNSRAAAIRQIVDLGERIKLNRSAALAGKYNIEKWGLVQDSAPDNCNIDDDDDENEGVSINDAAACDVWQWRKSLERTLPQGRATIERISTSTDGNQLRIIVAWQLNEKANSNSIQTLDSGLTIKDENGNMLCPNQYICHLQYLEI